MSIKTEDGIVIKVRETTREGTFTIPMDDEERQAFFHDESWDELHIVHQETKVLLAVYSRAQVFATSSRPNKDVRRSRSGRKVQVMQVN